MVCKITFTKFRSAIDFPCVRDLKKKKLISKVVNQDLLCRVGIFCLTGFCIETLAAS